MTTLVYTDAELDELLRGDGRSGAIGVSAIDGLIAAIVAGPCFVEPFEWMGLVMGRTPSLDPASPDFAIVTTLANLYNQTSTTLFDHPRDYRPKFMHHEGRVVIGDWVTGFMLGVAMRRDQWSIILLTGHRRRLAPILAAYEAGPDLLPDMAPAEKQRLKRIAHEQIADTVIAISEICMPHRAAAARAESAPRSARRRRA